MTVYLIAALAVFALCCGIFFGFLHALGVAVDRITESVDNWEE